MRKRKFRIGDKVLVIALPRDNYAPGVKDELGTEKLLQSMLGKVYAITGFGKYDLVELQPTRRDTIWIEPKFLKLHARKGKDGAKATFR